MTLVIIWHSVTLLLCYKCYCMLLCYRVTKYGIVSCYCVINVTICCSVTVILCYCMMLLYGIVLNCSYVANITICYSVTLLQCCQCYCMPQCFSVGVLLVLLYFISLPCFCATSATVFVCVTLCYPKTELLMWLFAEVLALLYTIALRCVTLIMRS